MRWHWYWPPSPQRRALRRRRSALGIGWATSPLRKFVQTVSLLVFLALYFWVLWPYEKDAAAAYARREVVEAEAFLALDPLVSMSTAIAARMWVGSLAWAAAMLAAGLLVPRLFCGYLCPLGTCIDAADWAVGRRLRRLHLPMWGRWVRMKHALLAAVLASAVAGTTLSGFVAPIPILTRGLAFLLGPLQSRLVLGPETANAAYAGAAPALALLAAVLAATLLGPRFWCRVLCPTGALFSLAARAGMTRRRVTDRCTHCGECEEACAFGAIRKDHSTRPEACAFCQQCGGACPTGAIEFVDRFSAPAPGVPVGSPEADGGLTRRAILVGGATGLLGGLAVRRSSAVAPDTAVIRPPGSLIERSFLAACIRCASCIKGCPTGVLVPMGSGRGFNALWTPHFDANRAGCAPDCNICGQVCPTGAIRPLPIGEKRAAHVGLAGVNETTCHPHAHTSPCRLCMDACTAAGYNAIEFILVGVETDASGMPVDGTGDLAPAVIADRCVGCGLCQAVCHKVNVSEARTLDAAAIVVHAAGGPHPG